MVQSTTSRTFQRVGFFGPFGTFTEQAVRTQDDLAAAELIDYPTVPDVLDAVAAGEVDCGVVPIENSIEGVVNFTQDALSFDYELLIQREIVLDIEHCLVGAPGLTLDQVKAVVSIPVATAQCHRFLRERLRSAEVRGASSTARAALLVAEGDGVNGPEPGLAAIAPRVAAERYGWGSAQVACLDSLWTRESGWRVHASNSRTGAYGIPQAVPGSKMSAYGADWRTNPVTQIQWGLGYIREVYRAPCDARSAFQAKGWY